jgi:hypothetical protein
MPKQFHVISKNGSSEKHGSLGIARWMLRSLEYLLVSLHLSIQRISFG